MRTTIGTFDQRDARADVRSAPRLHINGISELSPGRDEQLAQVFRNMRAALKISRETLSRRLATTPPIIDSFEAGAITALPRWNETVRIVKGYCELLRLDPEPILWRVRNQMEAVTNSARPAPPPTPPRPSRDGSGWSRPPAMQHADASDARPRRRRKIRALFALSAPVALAAGLIYLTQTMPGPVYAAVGFLPEQVAIPMRAGLDFLILFNAPSRDGLRWIEVADPRVRKADKLHTGER
jgi:hypothetical protein